MAQSIQYTSLPRDDSDTEPDMESFGEQEEGSPPSQLEILMQMINQMERQAHAKDAETLNLKSKLQAVEQKEESKAYAQRRETKATPETHYPIARVTRMLEQSKKPDNTKEYIEKLSGDICQADRRTYAELSKARDRYGRKILKFVENAPRYDGSTEKL